MYFNVDVHVKLWVCYIIKVRKTTKIRNQYNQEPHLTSLAIISLVKKENWLFCLMFTCLCMCRHRFSLCKRLPLSDKDLPMVSDCSIARTKI